MAPSRIGVHYVHGRMLARSWTLLPTVSGIALMMSRSTCPVPCYRQFPGVTSWLPTAAGLGLIPFIVAPLDNLVEEVGFRHDLEALLVIIVPCGNNYTNNVVVLKNIA